MNNMNNSVKWAELAESMADIQLAAKNIMFSDFLKTATPPEIMACSFLWGVSGQAGTLLLQHWWFYSSMERTDSEIRLLEREGLISDKGCQHTDKMIFDIVQNFKDSHQGLINNFSSINKTILQLLEFVRDTDLANLLLKFSNKLQIACLFLSENS